MTSWLASVVCAAALLGPACSASAADLPGLSVIHTFGPVPDGAFYQGGDLTGLLAGPGGVLYGTSQALVGYPRGPENIGALVYQLTPPAAGKTAWTFTDLHDFKFITDKYGNPSGPDLAGPLESDAAGALYGVTLSGVYHGSGTGTAFRLTPAGPGQTTWAYAEIYHFVDIINPTSVTYAEGSLYGIATRGNDYGPTNPVIFHLIPPAAGQTTWRATSVYDMRAADGHPAGTLLARRIGGVMTLFGVTPDGGASGHGTVFQVSLNHPLDPNSYNYENWSYADLHDFSGQGAVPTGPQPGLIADRALNLYGVTNSGVDGAVFRLSPPSPGIAQWSYDELHRFGGSPDGALPSMLLAEYDGKLYGATISGGSACAAATTGCGSFFKVTPRDYGGHLLPWNEVTLGRFSAPLAPTGVPVIAADSATSLSLYGVFSSGAEGSGSVFRLQIAR